MNTGRIKMIANIFRTHFNQKKLWSANHPQHCPLQREPLPHPSLCSAEHHLLSAPGGLSTLPTCTAPASATGSGAQQLRSPCRTDFEDTAISCECFKIFIFCPVADSFWSINNLWMAIPLCVIHTQWSLGMQLASKGSVYSAHTSPSMASFISKLYLC